MEEFSKIFKFPNFQFVPIEKTPWGGSQISQLKRKYFPNQSAKIPERIGESLEARFDHLQLKWIEACEPLSIQVHPNNSNSLLTARECGKPEAWFVHSLQNPSPLYLGFKEGYSQEQIKDCLLSSQAIECLHSFIPKKNDYISIPTGCVHAVGAGIFIAEPQNIVPNKEGVTWRIYDWDRRYNTKGVRDNSGALRELHLQKALSAIDWNLPRGQALENVLVNNLTHNKPFLGNSYNPFCTELYTQEGHFSFKPLGHNEFSILTVFDGVVTVSCEGELMTFTGGESGLIQAEVKIEIHKKFQDDPCVLLFGSL